jgi:hypothetical protein
VKKLVFGVITDNVKQVEKALRRAAVNPKSVIAVIEAAAKLNREIGPMDAAGSAPTIINFHLESLEESPNEPLHRDPLLALGSFRGHFRAKGRAKGMLWSALRRGGPEWRS